MPTGNEFSVVMFGQSEESYKQTDREMSPGVEPQIGGPSGPSSPGSYPQVYDRQAGSEPLGTSSDDNPFYYPQKVFEPIQCTGPGQSYVTTERESIGGEFNACHPGLELGKFSQGDNIVPSTVPSKQFSSNKEGDPKILVRQAVDSINAHASLNEVYGLHQPDATIGSHPWLRDELSNPTELEPGNAEPFSGMKVPERAKAGR